MKLLAFFRRLFRRRTPAAAAYPSQMCEVRGAGPQLPVKQYEDFAPLEQRARECCEVLESAGMGALGKANTLLGMVLEARGELVELRAWKASMLKLEGTWDEQTIGHLLGFRLGTGIREQLQPAIRRLLVDKQLLDAVQKHMLGVWWNDRHAGFVVQKHFQTVGNLAHARAPRQGLRAFCRRRSLRGNRRRHNQRHPRPARPRERAVRTHVCRPVCRTPVKFITNVRDARAVVVDGVTKGHAGDALCITCLKEMPGCWDTVCASCGDTSCYAHSHIVGERWLCERCFRYPSP